MPAFEHCRLSCTEAGWSCALMGIMVKGQRCKPVGDHIDSVAPAWPAAADMVVVNRHC